jgi:murein DD-endopeptidase MepM/ murein hydrolase activator NlpD
MGDWELFLRTRSVLLLPALLLLAGLLYVMSAPQTPEISAWRGAGIGGQAAIIGEAAPRGGLNPDAVADQRIPTGNPLRDRRTVMTQGYGVGTHTPAEVWGGVDLAIDGDGNGHADPEGTWDAPVYATHGGTATVRPDSWPGGNCILLRSEGYRTTYCHLSGFAISDGQQVQRGELIGYVGSTGNSSGPHLHYEVWVNEINHNPLNFGAVD